MSKAYPIILPVFVNADISAADRRPLPVTACLDHIAVEALRMAEFGVHEDAIAVAHAAMRLFAHQLLHRVEAHIAGGEHIYGPSSIYRHEKAIDSLRCTLRKVAAFGGAEPEQTPLTDDERADQREVAAAPHPAIIRSPSDPEGDVGLPGEEAA